MWHHTRLDHGDELPGAEVTSFTKRTPAIRFARWCLTLAVLGAAANPVSAQGVVPVESAGQCAAAGLLPPAEILSARAWKQLTKDILRDQKDVLKFSKKVGDHWVPVIVLTAATAGLVAADPADTPYFRGTSAFRHFNTVASGFNTAAAMAAVPVAFYLLRARAHDSYGKQTVFEAAEAIADVQILTVTAKILDRRLRPVDVPPGGNYADTWFKADVLGGQSFPSGHAVTAFALADVFVARYPDRRWLPWVAYGLAGMVGFSRLTLQSHFPSDVFAGAALGIVVTRGLVVHRPR